MLKIKSLVATAVFVAGTLTGVAALASQEAGASISQCASGHACMWSSSGFSNFLWGSNATTSYLSLIHI